MPHFSTYPDPEYSEDVEGSIEYDKIASDYSICSGKTLKIAAVIFWAPWILVIFGIIEGFSTYALAISVGTVIVVFISGINRKLRHTSSYFSTCKRCNNSTSVVRFDQGEFYACKTCKRFIRGEAY